MSRGTKKIEMLTSQLLIHLCVFGLFFQCKSHWQHLLLPQLYWSTSHCLVQTWWTGRWGSTHCSLPTSFLTYSWKRSVFKCNEKPYLMNGKYIFVMNATSLLSNNENSFTFWENKLFWITCVNKWQMTLTRLLQTSKFVWFSKKEFVVIFCGLWNWTCIM